MVPIVLIRGKHKSAHHMNVCPRRVSNPRLLHEIFGKVIQSLGTHRKIDSRYAFWAMETWVGMQFRC